MKLFFVYLLVIGVFVSLIGLILVKGNRLPVKEKVELVKTNHQAPVQTAVHSKTTGNQWEQKLKQPFVLSLMQIVVILIFARIFGFLARAIKQPVVVGELIAGICLGPSLLGWALPGVSQWIFPPESIKQLLFLSQIGLIFFMFVVGMEVDTTHVKHNKYQAVVISHVSILFPFFLGVWLAYFIYPVVAPAEVSFLAFALFIGIAMSITAFPVLARIIHERGLAGTSLGNLVITCAAADDITAWSMLSVVVAIAKADAPGSSLFLTIGLSVVYIFVMLYPARRLMRTIFTRLLIAGKRQAVVALAFVIVLLSSWATEVIGIHALFGAFLAGIIMPTTRATREMIRDKVKDLSMLLLLPIFFVCVGLNTQLPQVGEQQLWLIFLAIMLVAVGGKLGGSAIAARSMGISWRNSWSIGALMNTRGLVELVVLNIGYELGILSPKIFALMVLMALATTFMTGPLLYLAYRVETPPVSLSDIISIPAESKLMTTELNRN